MATVERFEDLEAWKAARELVKQVYRCSNQGPFAKDFPLRDQIRRASISIMANIAEGFERGGDGEFGQFLGIAKGSCGEVRSLLVIAQDQAYVSADDARNLQESCQRISRMLASFMKYLCRSHLPGRRLGTNSIKGA
jgi:four helix bundle protein